MRRNTRQREAIRGIFERVHRPLSPTEVHSLAKKEVRGIGIATVYRCLNAMVEDGYLMPVKLPGEPPRYERADHAHHHHFECRSCGKVYDIKGCPGNLKKMLPRGARIDGHIVLLYGRCRGCVG